MFSKTAMLDKMHPRVLKELAGVVLEPLAVIESSWRSGEVLD